MSHVVLFSRANFEGDFQSFTSKQDTMKAYGKLDPDPAPRDGTSSIAVISGKWEFFKGEGFTDSMGILEPGFYPRLIADIPGAVGVINDEIRSFRPV